MPDTPSGKLPPTGPYHPADAPPPEGGSEATTIPPLPPDPVSERPTVLPAVPEEAATMPPLTSGPTAAEPEQVPGYDVLKELGRGGMGVVYLARQKKPNRLVALKMVLAGGHAGAEGLARFLGEMEAVAGLQHPNIVQLFEAAEHDGLPYFTLEYVPGGNLHHKLAGTPLAPKEAARLVEQLARGMDHAHQKGIVHRDLKPANVLLTENDTPKITDFGIAKRGDAGMTAAGQVMGTPSYMAPEQAEGRNKDVGPAADVYALGAILYECLTGRPPFQGPTHKEIIIQVLMDDPVPPGRLAPKLPRDLETICLKCLRKEPAKRYAGAAALAEDLRRFQAGEPILARPVGRLQRGWKWAKRRPAAAVALAAFAVGTVLSFSLAIWALGERARADGNAHTAQENATIAQENEEKAKSHAADAQRQATLFRDQLERTRRGLYAFQLSQAATLSERDPGRALELLEDAECCPPDLRDFTWRLYHRLCKRERHAIQGAKPPLALAPDGKTLAAMGPGKTVGVWDLTTGKHLSSFEGNASFLAFSPDGRALGVLNDNGTVQLWDLVTRRQRANLERTEAFAFTSDGGSVVTFGDGSVRFFDTNTGRELRKVDGFPRGARACFSPDLKNLVTWAPEEGGSGVKLWNVNSAQVVTSLDINDLKTHETHVDLGPTDIAFSADGKTFAMWNGKLSPLFGGYVTLWDAGTGKWRLTLKMERVQQSVQTVAFAPDGKTLATGFLHQRGRGPTAVRLWDAATGDERTTLTGHTENVYSLAFSPDGKSLASASSDGVKLWDVGLNLEWTTLRIAGDSPIFLGSLAFSPDGKTLAAGSLGLNMNAGDTAKIKLWNVATRAERMTLTGHTDPVASVVFSPNGELLATASYNIRSNRSEVKLWQFAKGQDRTILTQAVDGFPSLAFSLDGKTLAVGQGGIDSPGKVTLLNLAASKELVTFRGHTGSVSSVAFSPRDPTLATAGNNEVKLWDVLTGKERATFSDVSGPLAFSPDGSVLATTQMYRKSAKSDNLVGVVKLWNVANGQELTAFEDKGQKIMALAFSYDGKTIATGSLVDDRRLGQLARLTLWDPVTGKERATLSSGRDVKSIAFSPDGTILAAAVGGFEVILWDAGAATPGP